MIDIIIRYHHFIPIWNLPEKLIDRLVANHIVEATFQNKSGYNHSVENVLTLDGGHRLFIFEDVVGRYLVSQVKFIRLPLPHVSFEAVVLQRNLFVGGHLVEKFYHHF